MARNPTKRDSVFRRKIMKLVQNLPRITEHYVMENKAGLDHWADILVIVIYFLAVLAVGLWSMTRSKRGNVKSYFMANRSMPWLAVGASLYSSNIGSEHFVGLAGAGASTGIALVMFEWLPVFLILLLGWFFCPVYVSSGVYTFPEYMEKRFQSKRLKNYMCFLTLFFAIVTKLAVSMFAGALFIQIFSGWSMYPSVILLLVITGSYTILGGLTAVMYTDTFQTGVMLIGAFILTGLSFKEVGGMEALREKYLHAIPAIRSNTTNCSFPREDAFHLFQDPITGYQPWPGLIIQATCGAIFYWCSDQVITQRALAAKNLLNAKAGTVLTGFLKILPLYIMVFPGMISRVLFPDEVGCVDPDECMRICDNPSGCSNIAYPKLVLELLPPGLRGFLMAVILSAIMSSLTSIFNSSSTVFTMDIWRQFRPNSSQRELLIIGKIFILIMCAIAVAWLPLTRGSQGGQLFAYIVMILSCLIPSLGIGFTFAIFWKRTTEIAVFYSILISHAIGIIRLVLEFVYPVPPCGEAETRPAVLYKVHILYFGAILTFLSVICITAISLITKPPTEQQLYRTTWWTMVSPANSTANAEITDTAQESLVLKTITSVDENHKDMGKGEEHYIASTTPKSLCQRLLEFLFGSAEEMTVKETQRDLQQIRMFLFEDPKWKRCVNGSAFVLIGIILFMLGVYM